MHLELLEQTPSNFWTGRVDHKTDRTAFRFHQVVSCISPAELASLETQKKRICIIGFSCDEGVRRNQGRTGAAEGPFRIRKELAKLPANFTESSELLDVGTICCRKKDMEKAQDELSLLVTFVLNHSCFPLVLGGGHEIVYGHYNGVKKFALQSEKNPPLLINFDAHFDLRPTNEFGTSGTSFFQIAQDHKSKNQPFEYICLGLQTYGNTKSLYNRADELAVQYYNAKDITENSKAHILSQIISSLEEHKSAYLTLDFDVLNSAYAPGVSSPQPFGISPEMMIYFLKPLLRTGKIKSLDIAEVAPRYDDDNQTSKLAAIVIYSIINVLTGA